MSNMPDFFVTLFSFFLFISSVIALSFSLA